MQQFYEPITFTQSKSLNRIFDCEVKQSMNHANKREFIAFKRQRDQIGRLLTTRSDKNQNNKQSIYKSTRRTMLRTNGSTQMNENQEKTNRAIQKTFRYTQILNYKQPKNNNKMRILTATSSSKFQVPAIGSYNIAQATDKFKYKKSRETLFSKGNQKSTRTQPSENKQQNNYIRFNDFQKTKSKNLIKQNNKHAINYKNSQLERLFQIKKLDYKIIQNFEQYHLKFKNLAATGMDLTQRLKSNIQNG